MGNDASAAATGPSDLREIIYTFMHHQIQSDRRLQFMAHTYIWEEQDNKQNWNFLTILSQTKNIDLDTGMSHL